MGLNGIIFGEDFPVVWSHTKYRMIDINMGHGEGNSTAATQNLLFVNAPRWVVSQSPGAILSSGRSV